jgi:hypothetical protein
MGDLGQGKLSPDGQQVQNIEDPAGALDFTGFHGFGAIHHCEQS